MAGTVATVPQVKRAVHHVTAPHHAPKALRRAVATTPVAPQVAQQGVPCGPIAGGALPAVPLVTYATPLPDEPGVGPENSGTPVSSPGGGFSGPGIVPVVGGIGIGPGGGGGGGTGGGGTIVTPTPTPTPGPGPGPVPEPSAWLMMIVGAGTLGATLRRRRRGAAAAGSDGRVARRAAAGSLLWSGSAAVEAGDMAATVAVKSAVASVAGKALLCVCPAAIVAGSAMTVPPVRQAVYAATMPAEPAAALPAMTTPSALPCAEPTTVPVAAQSVENFPAAVETVPATAAKATAAATTATVAPTTAAVGATQATTAG